MKINDVFIVTTGPRITQEEVYYHKGNLPCATAQTQNDGITWYCDERYLNDKYPDTVIKEPCITWAKDGYAGKMFYRDYNFFPNDHCGVLLLRDEYKDKLLLKFFMYSMQSYIMTCANQPNTQPMLYNETMSNIELPSNIYPFPSLKEQNAIVERFERIEEIKQNITKELDKIKCLCSYELKLSKYVTFLMSEITLLNKGSNKISEEMIYKNSDPQGIPVYSSATENAGLMGRVKAECYEKFQKQGHANELTWATNGYAGKVFYRDTDYLYSEKCGRIVIREKYRDKILPQYLCFMLNQITYKYKTAESNNGKLDIINMEKIPINIPIDSNGEIDVEFQKKIIELYQKIELLEKKLIFIRDKIA